MPRGDKSAYTDKQERKADHIAEGYENRGVPEKEAERRAWATVNKDDGGGKKSGSGRGRKPAIPPLTRAAARVGRPRLRAPGPIARRPRRRAGTRAARRPGDAGRRAPSPSDSAQGVRTARKVKPQSAPAARQAAKTRTGSNAHRRKRRLHVRCPALGVSSAAVHGAMLASEALA